MFQLIIHDEEIWDEQEECFIHPIRFVLTLEHSLDSLDKWESKWHKPFLTKKEMSYEETIDYIRCMTLTDNVPDDIYSHITPQHIKLVRDYMEDPMTATTFGKDRNQKRSSEQVTSELIYYWMVELKIPFECRYWHLNKLLTLIRVCNVKNTPNKKMSKTEQREAARQRSALNAARRGQRNTKG